MTEYKTFNRKVFDSKNADTPEPLFSDSPEFIVRAVNCHEELVQLITELFPLVEIGYQAQYATRIDNLFKRARGE